MADDQSLSEHDAFRLDPPVGVPEPAPLAMPRREIQRLPFSLSGLVAQLPIPGRMPQRSRTG